MARDSIKSGDDKPKETTRESLGKKRQKKKNQMETPQKRHLNTRNKEAKQPTKTLVTLQLSLSFSRSFKYSS